MVTSKLIVTIYTKLSIVLLIFGPLCLVYNIMRDYFLDHSKGRTFMQVY